MNRIEYKILAATPTMVVAVFGTADMIREEWGVLATTRKSVAGSAAESFWLPVTFGCRSLSSAGVDVATLTSRAIDAAVAFDLVNLARTLEAIGALDSRHDGR